MAIWAQELSYDLIFLAQSLLPGLSHLLRPRITLSFVLLPFLSILYLPDILPKAQSFNPPYLQSSIVRAVRSVAWLWRSLALCAVPPTTRSIISLLIDTWVELDAAELKLFHNNFTLVHSILLGFIDYSLKLHTFIWLDCFVGYKAAISLFLRTFLHLRHFNLRWKGAFLDSIITHGRLHIIEIVQVAVLVVHYFLFACGWRDEVWCLVNKELILAQDHIPIIIVFLSELKVFNIDKRIDIFHRHDIYRVIDFISLVNVMVFRCL